MHDSREMGVELTHVLAKRVPSTVKTENQGAPAPLRTIGVRFPFARMLVGRVACKAVLLLVSIVDVFLEAGHWR